jgi:hypothetical protein
MAFKISQKPTFVTRVSVNTPNQKGGFDLSTFNAEFKRVKMDELDELREQPQREVMRQVLVGWTDFLDDANEPVPFNDDTVLVLLNDAPALVGLRQAFWGSVAKASEKN